MKKRILSLILALSMVLSVLPLGAFAEGSTGDLIIGLDGYPVGSEGGSKDCNGGGNGNDWEYYSKSRILCLNGGTFNLSTTEPVKCEISSAATITGGTFNGTVTNIDGTISGGIFNGTVTNASTGKISGGTFAGSVTNSGIINGKGTFEGKVTNDSEGRILDGTFESTSSVENYGTIEKGTFNGTVTNSRYIENGTFNGTVTNNDAIFGGIFAGSVDNSNGGQISGGVFNSTTKPTKNACSITWDKAYPNAKITEVNGVSADWKPYVVVTSFTETREVIITADTEIFSLNGYPIDGSPYSSSYPDTTDKKTVKFTELGVLDNEMVLNGAITHGGDLVMENGYPKASIGGKYSCSGNGWEYSKKDASNPNGKLILKGRNREFDFSFTHPQNKTGTQPAPAVKCAIESGAKITGGTFEGSVKNHWDITDGIFYGTVTNVYELFDGSFDAGKISDGTFHETVTNNGGSIFDGTFKGDVINNNPGNIAGGTFAGIVTNSGSINGNGIFKNTVTNNGYIYESTFNGTVTNDANGTIYGGTFKGTVTNDNNAKIYGGVFNGKTGLDGVTGLHSITWDAASSKAKIVEVNGVPAEWDPYVVVTERTTDKMKVVTIKADTEIFSLNGQPIDDGNCKSSYDGNKNTVKFTMPGENVVLNGAITCTDLVMEGGYPKASNEGQISCSGTGWAYSKGDASNPTGTLYLMSGSGMFDFSSTHPQGKTQGTQPAPAVACEIEIQSGAEITGGIFDGTVTNNDGGTISGGTFNGTVTNDGTITGNGIFDGTVTNNDGGTISDGTFNGTVTNDGTITGNSTFLEKVTNNQGGNITNGTFNHTVENDAGGTISNGTFEQEVINNAGGEISGGTFKGTVLNGDGIITGGIFAAGLSRNDGSVTGGIFNGDMGLTDARHVTVTNGSLSQVNGVDPRNADGTTGTAWDLYAYKDTTVTITADTEIFSLNGQPIGTGNCNSSYGSDKTTVTFTMPDDKDVVLNGAIASTDLVMENGWPKDSNSGTTPCKGDGWQYIPNDPTYGDMLLLTGSNQTGGLFDFSTIGDGAAVKCNVFVGKPTAITGGEFNGKVFNNSGILGGTFHGEVDNMGPGRIVNGTFHGAVENNGMIENGAFNGAVENNGTINDGAFHDEVKNNGTIEKGTFNGAVENNGTIENGTFYDEVKNNGTINDGAFNGKVENNGTIEKGTFNGKVENNSAINSGTFNGPVDNTASGTIEKGTFHDSVENKGTINGGTFNGAVTSSGTVSESITGSGTLNGEPITKTPEPKPEPKPEPEPTTYTVTVIGGTIDGKTSVSAKENDTLTVVLDQNDIPDGMTFDMWSISSSKLSGDINVDYRAEAMTFQMPAEDVTIRAQYRSAEIIEDAAPSPLATAATIAVGGAAAGIVVWQGVSLGVDLYLTSALPQGVPVPTDRRALALLLWETAGKPEVALPTLYGDIPAEEIELQKATRWAVQNGLMDAADKKDTSFFDPDHYVTKMDVFGAWLRLKKLLGTT